MTLARFYESLGGSLPAVLARIPSEAMVRKFARMYAGDTSCDELVRAVEAKDWQTAFRAAHTLKGICLNLGFQDLYKESAAVTERLRECVKSESAPADSRVPMNLESRYQALIQKIRQLD